MDIRQITARYAVAPQIEPGDMEAIAAAGFRHVISNRPDSEVPPGLAAAALAEAATVAGLGFTENPIAPGGMTAEQVAAQADVLSESDGPVLAYCASGTRSAVVWAFSEAGARSADEILADLRQAGYPLDGLKPQLEALARG